MWVLDYWEYIASDMSRFHRIRRTEIYGMWPGEFFSLAALLFAYEGAVVGRYNKEREDAKGEDALAGHVDDGLIERG